MSASTCLLALFTTLALGAQEGAPLKLPVPERTGGATLREALWARHSERLLAGPALSLTEAGQLLWAAQGENRPGKRTAPSSHGKFALDVYLLTAGSDTLAAGLYRYLPAGTQLARIGDGTPLSLLKPIKGMQPWIADAPGVFVIAGDPSRLGNTREYATNYTFYEGGAAAQNLLLEAAALGLGAGTAAGIDLGAVGQALKLPAGSQALIALPVGHPKK